MKLVYSFDINNDDSILGLCKTSKELYNQALYEVRQSLANDNKFLFYQDLNKIFQTKTNLENEINYKKLKAQVSQQCLMLLDKNIKSYIKSIKKWSKDKNSFKGKPKLPNYLKKHNLLVYPNQSSSIKDGYINLSKTIKITIPQWDKYKDIIKDYNQIRVIPKNGFIRIEIIYNKEIDNVDLNYEKYSSIDIGINNLVSIIDEDFVKLINGKQIKSINQFFNKRLSHLQSIKDKQNIKTTNKIKNLYYERENKLKDLLHKISRYIVNLLIKNKTGNLIIGYNKDWKDSISLGRKNNQKFVQIPYLQLLNYIKYKCELVGIKMKLTEESYTSKCDALAFEHLGKNEKYLGKRIKRGLFQSSIGKLLNADINGAINILRKVVDNSYVNRIIDRGLVFNPVRIRNLYQLSSNF
jgi:putative transposase